MKRITLFSAVIAASLFGASAALACGGTEASETTAKADTPATPATPAAEVQLVTLVINDASCGSCVIPIREEVTALNGVIEVSGSDENFQWVHVTMAKDKVSTDQLIAAVKKAGYTATIKADAAKS